MGEGKEVEIIRNKSARTLAHYDVQVSIAQFP